MGNTELSIEVISLIVTIILAFTGYVVTYLNNLRLSRRADRLKLLSAQLNELYGPMYVITQTGKTLFAALRAKTRQEGRHYVDEDAPRRAEDVSEWQIWIEKVFLPLNEQLEQIVIEKAHLIREEEMPECLKLFVAHNAGYKAVVEKWRRGAYAEAVSLIPFPTEVNEYAERSYRKVKGEQLRMLGKGRSRRRGDEKRVFEA